MATTQKRPESHDVEMTYGSHLKSIDRRGNSFQDGDSGVYDQDEREIRRMGKISQFKVRCYCRTVNWSAVTNATQRVHRRRTMFATSASVQASWQVSLAYVQATVVRLIGVYTDAIKVSLPWAEQRRDCWSVLVIHLYSSVCTQQRLLNS